MRSSDCSADLALTKLDRHRRCTLNRSLSHGFALSSNIILSSWRQVLMLCRQHVRAGVSQAYLIPSQINTTSCVTIVLKELIEEFFTTFLGPS